ncbi:hypothetical protein [Nonomuraea polychroma]|nr:hypothetical protein [Nonomuraea polychroma]
MVAPCVVRDGSSMAAYIFCRISAWRTLQRAGTVMTAWPVAQLGAS